MRTALLVASRLNFGFYFLSRERFRQSSKTIRSLEKLVNVSPLQLSTE
jgi:hypothetical protein